MLYIAYNKVFVHKLFTLPPLNSASPLPYFFLGAFASRCPWQSVDISVIISRQVKPLQITRALDSCVQCGTTWTLHYSYFCQSSNSVYEVLKCVGAKMSCAKVSGHKDHMNFYSWIRQIFYSSQRNCRRWYI